MRQSHDFHELSSEILQVDPHLLLGLSGSLIADFPDNPLMLDGGLFNTAFQCEHAQFHGVPLRVKILDGLPGALISGHLEEQLMQLTIGNEPFVQPRFFFSLVAGAKLS